MKQTNLSIFIPHYGCPNCCSFCNQRTISGTKNPPSADEVYKILSEQQAVLAEKEMCAEIAFFGGSFTAVEREYMISLLKTARYFTVNFPGQFCGIRCSTRPDCIDREILDILKEYGVTTIELGAQSMNDTVLAANRRGHTADAVRSAAGLIKEYGFTLGLQMMTGLYKDKPEYCIETAREFIDLRADCVRVYPTVILKNTYLGELYENGEYESFGFDETIDLCAELLNMFSEVDIPVIRLGLHSGGDFDGEILGGVYHPALREITEGRIMFNHMKKIMDESGRKRFRIYTDRRNISLISGHKKENKLKLSELGYSFAITQEDGTDLRIEAMP